MRQRCGIPQFSFPSRALFPRICIPLLLAVKVAESIGGPRLLESGSCICKSSPRLLRRLSAVWSAGVARPWTSTAPPYRHSMRRAGHKRELLDSGSSLALTAAEENLA